MRIRRLAIVSVMLASIVVVGPAAQPAAAFHNCVLLEAAPIGGQAQAAPTTAANDPCDMGNTGGGSGPSRIICRSQEGFDVYPTETLTAYSRIVCDHPIQYVAVKADIWREYTHVDGPNEEHSPSTKWPIPQAIATESRTLCADTPSGRCHGWTFTATTYGYLVAPPGYIFMGYQSGCAPDDGSLTITRCDQSREIGY